MAAVGCAVSWVMFLCMSVFLACCAVFRIGCCGSVGIVIFIATSASLHNRVCMSEGLWLGPFCVPKRPVLRCHTARFKCQYGAFCDPAWAFGSGKRLPVKSFPRPLALASGCLCRVVVARLLPVVARLAMAACGFHSMLSMLTPSYSFRNSAILLSYCVRFTFISIDTLYLFPSGECCSFML